MGGRRQSRKLGGDATRPVSHAGHATSNRRRGRATPAAVFSLRVGAAAATLAPCGSSAAAAGWRRRQLRLAQSDARNRCSPASLRSCRCARKIFRGGAPASLCPPPPGVSNQPNPEMEGVLAPLVPAPALEGALAAPAPRRRQPRTRRGAGGGSVAKAAPSNRWHHRRRRVTTRGGFPTRSVARTKHRAAVLAHDARGTAGHDGGVAKFGWRG